MANKSREVVYKEGLVKTVAQRNEEAKKAVALVPS